MNSNKKPDTGEPPKGPPPPMAVDGDGRMTVEDMARIFGVPSHLLSQLKDGSFSTHATIENAEIGFIGRVRKRMRRLIKEYEKRSAELNRQIK
jgi:phage portal protein BeeE